MKEVSKTIESRFGACLFVDYGEGFITGKSLRGIKEHRFVTDEDIIKYPGEIDLSANVNFGELASIAKLSPNCKHYLFCSENT